VKLVSILYGGGVREKEATNLQSSLSIPPFDTSIRGRISGKVDGGGWKKPVGNLKREQKSITWVGPTALKENRK